MATSQTNPTRTKPVQKTVFDLTAFDDVKLVKTVTLPNPVDSIEAALQAVGNDKEALLAVINAGLEDRAIEAARNDMNGFQVETEDGEPGDPYTGTFANEETGKKINAAVLAMAKMFGYDKNLPVEKKRALKSQATEFLRSNPAVLESLKNGAGAK